VRVLILGAGEHASSTAHRLFRCGLTVVLTEVPAPLAVRRAVSFCSAVWEGEVVVEGVRAVHRPLAAALPPQPDCVTVVVDPDPTLVEGRPPHVLVDARQLHQPAAT